jgi:hypothetical protein
MRTRADTQRTRADTQRTRADTQGLTGGRAVDRQPRRHRWDTGVGEPIGTALYLPSLPPVSPTKEPPAARKFAIDSPVEEAVYCELVSEVKFLEPWRN